MEVDILDYFYMCIFLKCWQPPGGGFSIKRKESVMKLKELSLTQETSWEGKPLGCLGTDSEGIPGERAEREKRLSLVETR